MTMTSEIKYKMKCGCVHSKSGIKKTKAGFVCKEHGENIDVRLVPCLDCSVIFEDNSATKAPTRCPECQFENRRKKRKIYNQRKKERIASGKQAKNTGGRPVGVKNKPRGESVIVQYDRRGDYCSGVEACNISRELKCDCCKSFLSFFKGVDPGKSIFC